MSHRFVGIGFGAIQAGLFAYEARRTHQFESITVVARRPELVRSLRCAGGYTVNIARLDAVETEKIDRIQALSFADEHAAKLQDTLLDASEIAVAVASVDDYVSAGANSIHRVLAGAVRRKMKGDGPKVIIYCAENNHDAAQILEQAILSEFEETERATASGYFQTIDSVIGKMSRQVSDPDEIGEAGLMPMVEGESRAILVEEFNQIQIAKIDPNRTSGRGISIFEEKDDLAPFEHAKLHGHNATHALLAYFGSNLGLRWISDVCAHEILLQRAKDAFLNEAGAALINRYGGVDPMFSAVGFQTYADKLLLRMANPNLGDTCGRIGRDLQRKLGWNDRLVGTMRLVLNQGIEPTGYAQATLAALRLWKGHTIDLSPLTSLWRNQGGDVVEIEQIFGFLTINRAPFRDFMNELADAKQDASAQRRGRQMS